MARNVKESGGQLCARKNRSTTPRKSSVKYWGGGLKLEVVSEKIFKLNKQVVETEWKYVVDEDYVAASYCDSFGRAVYRMAHLNEAPGGSDRRLPKSI